MSDTCPRCGDEIRLTDPHVDCKGPPWRNDVGVPPFELSRLHVSGLLPDLEVLLRIVAGARELVDNTRCKCHPCWTSRGRHDPVGCTWAEIGDLREAFGTVPKESDGR